ASLLRTTPDEVEARVAALLDERRKLENELAGLKKERALQSSTFVNQSTFFPATVTQEPPLVNGIKFTHLVLADLEPKELRSLIDEKKKDMGSGVAAIVTIFDGKASIAVGVTDDLTGKVSAVDLVRAGVEALGGKGGGGRPDLAQGGGPDGSKATEAIAAVKAVLAG
ncbi:MAG TPA: DHHA1 domain-containing protein, partial [Novosphingobium sp.]|nr:DHHA1 domain-containing protein [Novosphingobium sp.]